MPRGFCLTNLHGLSVGLNAHTFSGVRVTELLTQLTVEISDFLAAQLQYYYSRKVPPFALLRGKHIGLPLRARYCRG